ncbi:MAG TPA: hypothetical protein DIS62_01410, partial [Candidatus Kerfeldbacteria bacterium]|nr:hypothetical protein [Candidatus Kerfeldbacteria bacterium]
DQYRSDSDNLNFFHQNYRFYKHDDPATKFYQERLNTLIDTINEERKTQGRTPMPYVRLFIAADNKWPNAWSFYDGTIVLNQSLINAMNNVSEVMAILVHEVSHFEDHFLDWRGPIENKLFGPILVKRLQEYKADTVKMGSRLKSLGYPSSSIGHALENLSAYYRGVVKKDENAFKVRLGTLFIKIFRIEKPREIEVETDIAHGSDAYRILLQILDQYYIEVGGPDVSEDTLIPDAWRRSVNEARPPYERLVDNQYSKEWEQLFKNAPPAVYHRYVEEFGNRLSAQLSLVDEYRNLFRDNNRDVSIRHLLVDALFGRIFHLAQDVYDVRRYAGYIQETSGLLAKEQFIATHIFERSTVKDPATRKDLERLMLVSDPDQYNNYSRIIDKLRQGSNSLPVLRYLPNLRKVFELALDRLDVTAEDMTHESVGRLSDDSLWKPIFGAIGLRFETNYHPKQVLETLFDRILGNEVLLRARFSGSDGAGIPRAALYGRYLNFIFSLPDRPQYTQKYWALSIVNQMISQLFTEPGEEFNRAKSEQIVALFRRLKQQYPNLPVADMKKKLEQDNYGFRYNTSYLARLRYLKRFSEEFNGENTYSTEEAFYVAVSERDEVTLRRYLMEHTEELYGYVTTARGEKIFKDEDWQWVRARVEEFIAGNDFPNARWKTGEFIDIQERQFTFEYRFELFFAKDKDERLAIARTIQEKYRQFFEQANNYTGSWSGYIAALPEGGTYSSDKLENYLSETDAYLSLPIVQIFHRWLSEQVASGKRDASDGYNEAASFLNGIAGSYRTNVPYLGRNNAETIFLQPFITSMLAEIRRMFPGDFPDTWKTAYPYYVAVKKLPRTPERDELLDEIRKEMVRKLPFENALFFVKGELEAEDGAGNVAQYFLENRIQTNDEWRRVKEVFGLSPQRTQQDPIKELSNKAVAKASIGVLLDTLLSNILKPETTFDFFEAALTGDDRKLRYMVGKEYLAELQRAEEELVGFELDKDFTIVGPSAGTMPTLNEIMNMFYTLSKEKKYLLLLKILADENSGILHQENKYEKISALVMGKLEQNPRLNPLIRRVILSLLSQETGKEKIALGIANSLLDVFLKEPSERTGNNEYVARQLARETETYENQYLSWRERKKDLEVRRKELTDKIAHLFNLNRPDVLRDTRNNHPVVVELRSELVETFQDGYKKLQYYAPLGFRYREIPAADSGEKPNTGILVQRVINGSALQIAGIREGDIITAIDTASVPNAAPQFYELLSRKSDGETVTLTVLRNGKERSFRAVVGQRARSEKEKISAVSAIVQVAQAYGAVGVRFLQWLGQYIRIDPSMQKGFQSVYDNVSLLYMANAFQTTDKAIETLGAERQKLQNGLSVSKNPDHDQRAINELTKQLEATEEYLKHMFILKKIGGGSIVTVYKVGKIKPDGNLSQEPEDLDVYKITNPNILERVNDDLTLVTKVINSLLTFDFKHPFTMFQELLLGRRTQYGIALRLMRTLGEWIREDVLDPNFLVYDQIYSATHEKYIAPNGIQIGVSKTKLPYNRWAKTESFEEGDTINAALQDITDSNPDALKRIDTPEAELTKRSIRGVVYDYVRHIFEPQSFPDGSHKVITHSDIHPGNALVSFTQSLAKLIDRNYYLVLEPQDVLLIQHLFSRDVPDREKLRTLIDYFLLENNVFGFRAAYIKAKMYVSVLALGSDRNKPEEVILALLQQMDRENLTVPLRMRIFVKNMSAINRMLSYVGNETLTDFMEYYTDDRTLQDQIRPESVISKLLMGDFESALKELDECKPTASLFGCQSPILRLLARAPVAAARQIIAFWKIHGRLPTRAELPQAFPSRGDARDAQVAPSSGAAVGQADIAAYRSQASQGIFPDAEGTGGGGAEVEIGGTTVFVPSGELGQYSVEVAGVVVGGKSLAKGSTIAFTGGETVRVAVGGETYDGTMAVRGGALVFEPAASTKKSPFGDFGGSTQVESDLARHLVTILSRVRESVKTLLVKGVEVAGFAPARPWMTSQVPHSSTPTPKISIAQRFGNALSRFVPWLRAQPPQNVEQPPVTDANPYTKAATPPASETGGGGEGEQGTSPASVARDDPAYKSYIDAFAAGSIYRENLISINGDTTYLYRIHRRNGQNPQSIHIIWAIREDIANQLMVPIKPTDWASLRDDPVLLERVNQVLAESFQEAVDFYPWKEKTPSGMVIEGKETFGFEAGNIAGVRVGIRQLDALIVRIRQENVNAVEEQKIHLAASFVHELTHRERDEGIPSDYTSEIVSSIAQFLLAPRGNPELASQIAHLLQRLERNQNIDATYDVAWYIALSLLADQLVDHNVSLKALFDADPSPYKFSALARLEGALMQEDIILLRGTVLSRFMGMSQEDLIGQFQRSQKRLGISRDIRTYEPGVGPASSTEKSAWQGYLGVVRPMPSGRKR